MIIIVALFGGLSFIGFLISSIISFVGGQIGLGVAMLLSALYDLAVTVVLIRTDGKSTEAENEINKLKTQIEALKKWTGFNEAEPKTAQDMTDEETYDEEIEPNMEGVSYCKECGYQLFPEDKICPNCKKKIEK